MLDPIEELYASNAEIIYEGTAQRFALLAGGWAWTMLIIVGNAEARKMLENAAESHQSSARFVGRLNLGN